MKRFIISIALLFLLSFQSIAQTVNVPLGYWGYEFLDRCETKGLVNSVVMRVKPYSRETVTRLIIEIENNLKNSPEKFSKTDHAQFEQIKGDFVQELLQMAPDIKTSMSEKHLCSHFENNSQIHFDLLVMQNMVYNKGEQYDPAEKISETTVGGILRGHLGGKLGYYVDARNSLLRGTDIDEESFDVSKGSPTVTSGSNVFSDRATAYFIWERPWLRVQVGKDEMEWGPGYHSGLSLTRNMPPADMIKLNSTFKRFSFTSVHMFLNNSLGPKYLTGHRIDIRVLRGLYVGGTETVIYGDRDVEMSYLNPLMPYHVAEHHLGDKDNNTMSLDITLTRFAGIKAYAEFFIDDMTTAESLNRFYGNKFAFLTGVHLASPLNIQDLDLRLEYSRVEPFVYAHHDSINIYSHYDKAIGHWLGPNSDTALLLASYRFNRDFKAELSFERIRKGTGTISTTDRPESGLRKHFLGGTVDKRNLFGIKLVDQIRRDIYVAVSYTYSQGDNINQIASFGSNDHLARFEFSMNY